MTAPNEESPIMTSMNIAALENAVCTYPDACSLASGDETKHDNLWISLSALGRLLNIAHIGDEKDIRFQRVRVKASQWVFGCGEKFDAIFIVHSGFLKTGIVDDAGNEQILGFPMRGDLLGIDGLHNERYASQVVALTDCELVIIPFRHLADLSGECAMLENWLYRAISRELAREHTVIGLLGTLGAEARVARFLVSLSERFQALGYSPTEFNLRMTRQDIGSYLGLTLETVSRSLSALQLAELISVNQRAVSLKNIDELRTLQKLQPHVKAANMKRHAAASKQSDAPLNKQRNSIWSSLSLAA